MQRHAQWQLPAAQVFDMPAVSRSRPLTWPVAWPTPLPLLRPRPAFAHSISVTIPDARSCLAWAPLFLQHPTRLLPHATRQDACNLVTIAQHLLAVFSPRLYLALPHSFSCVALVTRNVYIAFVDSLDARSGRAAPPDALALASVYAASALPPLARRHTASVYRAAIIISGCS